MHKDTFQLNQQASRTNSCLNMKQKTHHMNQKGSNADLT